MLVVIMLKMLRAITINQHNVAFNVSDHNKDYAQISIGYIYHLNAFCRFFHESWICYKS